MSKIFLIRHGQASWGKRNYDVLSATGIRQAHVVGEHLKSMHCQQPLVISGGHERHKDTATFCLQSMRLEPRWLENTDWNEFDFQNIIESYKPLYKIHSLMIADLALRKAPQKKFKQTFEKAINIWMENNDQPTPYRESWEHFSLRVIQALEHLQQQAEAPDNEDRDILVFTSGGVISVIMCHLLGLPLEQWRLFTGTIVNTSMTQISFEQQQARLVTFNEHCHLLGKHASLYSTH